MAPASKAVERKSLEGSTPSPSAENLTEKAFEVCQWQDSYKGLRSPGLTKLRYGGYPNG